MYTILQNVVVVWHVRPTCVNCIRICSLAYCFRHGMCCFKPPPAACAVVGTPPKADTRGNLLILYDAYHCCAAAAGISGGERKRVSIGHEIITNPSIVMLDEPTSGLDSTTALHLLVTLRQLAEGGRAICTTIHQPSSRLYRQLNKLMLLADGHVMYYGDADQVSGLLVAMLLLLLQQQLLFMPHGAVVCSRWLSTPSLLQ